MAGSLTLVVPVYNEAERLPRYLDALVEFVAGQPAGSELVVVDDGSTDESAEITEKALADRDGPGRAVRLPHRGKGAAVAAGLDSATTELAGFCDLDLSTPLHDLELLVRAAGQVPTLAIGSRDLPTSTVTQHESVTREMLGRAFNRVVQLVLVPGVVDTQCGAKVAATEVWRRILPRCREEGFAWDVEVIAIARSLGIQVQEIGVEWRHDPGSQVRVARDGVAMLAALPRIHRNVNRESRRRAESAAVTAGGVFAGDAATTLVDASRHWWFRSKAAFVSRALRKTRAPRGWLVDVGAGSGNVTALLGWAPTRALVVEASPELVGEAVKTHALQAVRADGRHLPLPSGSASVVTLLDVIEHLDDPAPALREAHRVVDARGRLVVTVPAHPSLWSAADEMLGHARRYSRSMLRAELEAAGFEVLILSHVFSWLVLPVWLRRRMRPGSEPELGLDVTSSLIDAAALILTRLEWAIVARRPLPAGTSILCVAQCSSSLGQRVAGGSLASQ